MRGVSRIRSTLSLTYLRGADCALTDQRRAGMNIEVIPGVLSDGYAGQGRRTIQRLANYADGSTRSCVWYWRRVCQGCAMRPQVGESLLPILIAKSVSMGGLLAADTLRAFVQSRPDKTAPLWPKIVALVAFDTPVRAR